MLAEVAGVTSDGKIRWGILGVAKINGRLLPSFRTVSNGQLTSIASRTPQRAADAANAAGIPRHFGSYEALIDDPDIDAVYIPLPNHLHAEWARKAGNAGKHVLCEKPLTPTAAEAANVVAYCRRCGVRLMDGFMWPHHPRTAAIRQVIDSGRIGRVNHIHGVFSFPLPLDPSNIRLAPDKGGGSLLDVGCYPVYGIRWAMGAEPVRVFAWSRQQFGVDLAMAGTLLFADGRTASFDCAFDRPLRQQFEVVGTAGRIWIPEMWVPTNPDWFVQEGETTEAVKSPASDQIRHMLENFAAAVLEGREPSPSPEEAVKTLRVLDALAASAREGRPVDVTA